MEKYMDRDLTPEERANDLLGKMSFEEKIGQLTGCIETDWSEDVLEKDYPHGVGQIAYFGGMDRDSITDAVRYQRETQRKVMELSEHHIPAFFHVEGLCGVMLPEAVSFPSGIGQGATFDPKLQYQIGEIVGRQAAAAGASQVFAPVLDISRDSRFGRQGETYGEDPTLAAAMGSALVRGIQKDREGCVRTAAVAKHFLGYHDTQGGIHASACDIPDRLLEEIYAKPFQAAISCAGLRGVMPCYSSINGEPVSISAKILTQLLRERMGFDGIAVSDYSAVREVYERQKVGESYAQAGRFALEAGMNQELPSAKCVTAEHFKAYLQDPEFCEVMDRAVWQILREKFRQGLFEHPFAADDEAVHQAYSKEEDRSCSFKAAAESMVLLKNNGILPVRERKKRIAVIGYHADSVRALFGGYTFMSMTESRLGAENTMAGMAGSENSGEGPKKKLYPGSIVEKEHPDADRTAREIVPGIHSVLEEFRIRWPEADIHYAYGYPCTGNDCSGHEAALKEAEMSDLVIMTVGGKYGTGSTASMGEGIDAVDINLPYCQETLIEKIAGLHKPVILIHFGGRPISSDAAENGADAVLEVWNPSERGAEAIVKTIGGEYNPGGKMPVSTAYCAGQIPVYYNHPNGSSYHQNVISAFHDYVDCSHEPRYPFGFGLSYTNFIYSELQIENEQIPADGLLNFSVRVKNGGEYDGEEVVQAYIHDCQASMVRPVQELIGFRRIFLRKGEEKKVTFHVRAGQFAFLDRRMKFVVEAGKMELMVGSSSKDIRCRGSFTITDSVTVDEKTRGFYADTEENEC